MSFDIVKTNFVNALKKQTEYYRELKKIILIESEELNKKEKNELEKVLNQEEDILNKIKSVEIEKQNLFKDLIKKMGFESDKNIKLREVLLKMGKQDADEIEKAIVDLLQVVKEIDDINSKNIHIIKNYLSYFDFSKKIREKLSKTENITYTSSGIKKMEIDDKQNISKIDKTI